MTTTSQRSRRASRPRGSASRLPVRRAVAQRFTLPTRANRLNLAQPSNPNDDARLCSICRPKLAQRLRGVAPCERAVVGRRRGTVGPRWGHDPNDIPRLAPLGTSAVLRRRNATSHTGWARSHHRAKATLPTFPSKTGPRLGPRDLPLAIPRRQRELLVGLIEKVLDAVDDRTEVLCRRDRIAERDAHVVAL